MRRQGKSRLLDNNNDISFLTLHTFIITPGLQSGSPPPHKPSDYISGVGGGSCDWGERGTEIGLYYILRSNEQSPVLLTISYDMKEGWYKGRLDLFGELSLFLSLPYLPLSLFFSPAMEYSNSENSNHVLESSLYIVLLLRPWETGLMQLHTFVIILSSQILIFSVI